MFWSLSTVDLTRNRAGALTPCTFGWIGCRPRVMVSPFAVKRTVNAPVSIGC
jgi:hypothetical protein